MDDGDYFDKEGNIPPSQGLNYLKSDSWTLDPALKSEPNDAKDKK